jgi:AAA15 family ATPase/GTPase
MLVQFSVKNYRSLKDKTTLSMLAGADKEHIGDLIAVSDKKSLVPVAAIYGANSSGKSNILMALRTMQDMITGASAQLLKEKKLPYDPFLFSHGTEGVPTEFEIIYYYNGVKYAYGFSYDTKQILTEDLYHWPNGREALIFSRNRDQYEFRENVNEQMTLAGRTPSNKLYLVSSNEWNAPQTELAYKWFAEKLLPYDEHDTPDITNTVLETPGNPIINPHQEHPLRDKIVKEFILADLGIVGADVSVDPVFKDKRNVWMIHRVVEDGSARGVLMPLEQESKGTQRFFSRIGPWILALEKGGILIVDEIEASLHPMLTRRLVEMMQNSEINKNHAQLIFTTHDVMLLDLTLLRRDQIWFTEKDPETLSTDMFSLWDFSARKGENIRKGYLQGRFGAIPFLGGDPQWPKK